MSAMDDVTVFEPEDKATLERLKQTRSAAVQGAGGPHQRHALADSLDRALGRQTTGHWRILEVQADRGPYWSLASALLQDADIDRAAQAVLHTPSPHTPTQRISHLAEQLESGPALLDELLGAVEPRDAHTLVLLDPFDWDPTPGAANDTRNALVSHLLAACKRPENRLSVLFSLSDAQKAACAAVPGLNRLVDSPEEGGLPPGARTAAILFGERMAAAPADHVASDLQRRAAELDGAALDLGDNIAVLEDAVRPEELGAASARQAEDFFQRLDPQRQRVLERVMRAVTYCGMDATGLIFESRPRARKTLQRWLSSNDRSTADALLDTLSAADCRLLSQSGTHPRIGLASADLLETWPRLKDWARQERRLRKGLQAACEAYRDATTPGAGAPLSPAQAYRLLERMEANDGARQPYQEWSRRYIAQPWFQHPADVRAYLEALAAPPGSPSSHAGEPGGKDTTPDLLLAAAAAVGLIGLATGLYIAFQGDKAPQLFRLPFGQ